MAKKLKGNYIDRIMLGFLGASTVKIPTSHPQFLELFKKYYFPEAYSFVFWKKDTKVYVCSLINFIEVSFRFTKDEGRGSHGFRSSVDG